MYYFNKENIIVLTEYNNNWWSRLTYMDNGGNFQKFFVFSNNVSLFLKIFLSLSAWVGYNGLFLDLGFHNKIDELNNQIICDRYQWFYPVKE